MRLLLDTHIVLAILRKDVGQRFPEIAALLGDSKTEGFVSVASLWETAIKARLGKLDTGMPLEDIARSLEEIGLILLRIEIQHVITAADPEPDTRDPFDRLLLAQCKVEGLQLATVDRLLVDHPLALRL
ncbi:MULTISPECIES: type II toxin-antitoxin system VapC family toxin [Rhizobium]|uniref:type II toxin-antitoxin system VapC family toxin n=1 Tax=Rhizobium TaxID=379 RepID=UPI000BE8BC2A|nr:MULTISPECIES: type II toxin-antitoxin system VapC family toxin [Rhizobium]MBY4587819.1 type II toxin-antitoxin system VapC family toxin [Rhizobium redzepovicii]MBY4617535.1 type II toxin-antitoxin system VapC family toxin [Rhizobium redzepovicii]MDF0659203.1 type II toxin-antitoxin system VapC family toxin [Rhizobium sp. BC49]MDR9781916.1 type II toxin-antitoxin system VapC family toxin [Rhizobium redzepovicii]PDS84663.1 PIN domain nuclease [Rhizobium sp. L18]